MVLALIFFDIYLQANDDGSVLIVVNSHAGQIFTVDPETGTAALIDLGGVLVHADGLVRVYFSYIFPSVPVASWAPRQLTYFSSRSRQLFAW